MLSTNTFTKGMNQDIHPKHQPEGSYRYALNAALETTEGGYSTISNELGNNYCASNWPSTKQLIGNVLTENDDVVVFFYDGSDPLRPEHEIGIYNTALCTYTSICIDKFLNFSNDHPISALFRIRNGCDRLVYFTDNYNVYRVINVSDTSEWVDPDNLSLLHPALIAYTKPYAVPKMISDLSTIDDIILDGLGNLEYGSYAFYFRYLDKDLNPTNEWIPISHYIKIGTGLQSNSNSSQLHGASNTESSPFYDSRSNKAIRLELANLDANFRFYQIAVIKKTSDSGAYSGADLLYPIAIDNPANSFFIYTGYEDNIYGELSVDEVLIPNQPVDLVTTHAIDDRRLYLANLSKPLKDYVEDSVYSSLYPPKDYVNYQAFASRIKVKYYAEKVEGRQAKTGLNNAYGETLLPDEVYALGIIYVHSDGRESPVFHIPGRPADIDMTGHTSPIISTYTNWDTDDITGDDNIFDATKTKRWQVHSTATLETSFTGLNSFSGYLGYYETNTTYPTIETCDPDTNYWGTDFEDNEIIAGETKIRHHRMPAEWLYKDTAVDNDFAAYPQYKYNLLFDEIEAPDESVVGYYIVIGDRTDNKTVLDRGYLRAMYWDPQDEVFAHNYVDWDSLVNFYPDATDPRDKWNYYSFTSPTTVYGSQHLGGDYISIAKKVRTSTTDKAIIDPASTSVDVNEFDVTINVDTRIYEYTTFKRPDRYNYKIEGSGLLRKTSPGKTRIMPDISNSYYTQSTIGDRLENRSFNNDVAYLELDTYLADYADLTINCGANGCSPTEPGIDTYNFIATTKSNRDVYTNLFNIQYKKLTSTWTETQLGTISILNAGDHFIPHFDVLEAFYENSAPIVSFVSTPLVYNKNLEFRNYSTLERGKFTWYKYQGGYDHKSLARHMAFKYYELVADEGEFFPEYYSLSDKYNTQLPDNIYFPIPFNYNLCKDCIEDMPYRVYYSELDNEEQSNDNLRIIKANNYTNILGEHGPIKNLLVSRNKLFLTTDNTSMFLPTKPQSLQTNDNSIFIGTGEVLSLPPQYLSETSYPIGGCPSFKHVNVNEFGAVYIDPKSERVFLITDSLSDLSSNGLRNFWKENGEVKFLNQFKKLTNQEYEHTQLTHPYGVGYVITFDPRFKRVIIHKRDYEFLSNQLTIGIDITTPNVFWYDGSNYYLNDSDGMATKINFTNSQYFQNKSFTVSYSFVTNSWVSFHSYFPSYLMNNHETFFSDGPWRHNEGKRQTYYDITYPHIIDIVIPQHGLDGKLSTNVFYTSDSEWYNPSTKSYQTDDETYTGLIAYNSNQSSGYQEVVVKSNPFQQDQLGSILVDKVDNKYRINDLRDLTIFNHNPIWSNHWDLLQSTPYLDKTPNIFNLDQSKSFFNQRRFRDHYLGLRFYFNPTKDIKISTDVVATLHSNRNR